MVFFSGFMMWAFSPNEYKSQGQKATGIFRPLWDSINFSDFVVEILGSLKFFIDYARGKPNTHSTRIAKGSDGRKLDFGEAFGVEGSERGPAAMRRNNAAGVEDEENVRLQPYPSSPPPQLSDGSSQSIIGPIREHH
jgi:hypothetical protein